MDQKLAEKAKRAIRKTDKTRAEVCGASKDEVCDAVEALLKAEAAETKVLDQVKSA